MVFSRRRVHDAHLDMTARTGETDMTDLIALRGRIHTLDDGMPEAEAVAVRNGRILAVGDTPTIGALSGPRTTVIDLGGRVVLPGFTECHIHYHGWALCREDLDLSGVPSLRHLLELVKEAAADSARAHLRGGWILGHRWNESWWPERRVPTRDDLDRVVPDRPVMLWRTDIHRVVVNSKALELAGIDGGTPDPPQGVIGRDESGRPDGLLQDFAINLVKDRIPVPGEAETEEAFARAVPALHELGITGIHDLRMMDGIEGPEAFRIFQRLREAGRLPVRVWECLPGHLFQDAVALGLRTGMGDEFLRIGHVKLFSDGSLGARTAWMREPYEDGWQGIALTPMDEIYRTIETADAHGLAVSVHAIGDRATHELISVFERLERERPASRSDTRAGAPHRIEHLQFADTDDLARLAKLRVMASVQPRQATDDIMLTEKEVGPRGAIGYRFRDMLDAGIELAMGSDCPVAELNPLDGIHAAVTRQRDNGFPDGGWYPDQRLTVEEAVGCYTAGAAKITGRGHELGRIAPGMWADMVVLDRDIFACEPARILETRVDLTMVGGRIVFER